MEQSTHSNMSGGKFIYLSRNSKLARMFQEAGNSGGARTGTFAVEQHFAPAAPRTAATACPKLQAVGSPALEFTRLLAAALMREQAAMKCRIRVLTGQRVRPRHLRRGAHQHCPFIKD